MKYSSLEALREALGKFPLESDESVRILLVPASESSEEQMLGIYRQIFQNSYESVVFVESRLKETDKKIPMPAHNYFETQFGMVQVHDGLRNELCDEDDDFFIDNHSFGNDLELFRHLPYLQAALGEFQVVNVHICDEDPSIVRELSYVLSELLGGRGALVVIACSSSSDPAVSETIRNLVINKDHSNLMNVLNSGEFPVTGSAAFQAGVLLASTWGLDLRFLSSSGDNDSGICGYSYIGSES